MCPAAVEWWSECIIDTVFDGVTTAGNQQVILKPDPLRVMILIACNTNPYSLFIQTQAGNPTLYTQSPNSAIPFARLSLAELGPAIFGKFIVQIQTITSTVLIQSIRKPKDSKIKWPG